MRPHLATAALLLTAVHLHLCHPAAGQNELHYAALQKHLDNITSQFGRDILPRRDASTRIELEVQLRPLQLVEVDSVRENLQVAAMLIVSWKDELVVWNSSEFGGLHAHFMDHKKMWTPEILIHGAVGEDYQLLKVNGPLTLQLRLNHTRTTAIWFFEFHFTCEFDLSKFPVDHQECKLPLTATAFKQPLYATKTSALPLPPNAAVAMFSGNSEWNLTDFEMRNDTISLRLLGGARYNVTTATAVFRIRRYSTYYDIVSTVPLVLLTALQLLIYLVPLESGEKTGCGVTVLLSFTVFLLLIDQISPKSDNVPVMVYFITLALVISAASLVYNCLLLRMHQTSGHVKMPRWMSALLVSGLGSIMCLHGCAGRDSQYAVSDDHEGEDGDACSDWQRAAAALERLGFLVHLLLTVAGVLWMQLQL